MTTTTPSSTKSKRRWFQFSLRTFLIGVTLIGCVSAWVGTRLEQKRRHVRAMQEILSAGGRTEFVSSVEVPAWKEWLFGIHAAKPIEMDLAGTKTTDSILAQTRGMYLFSLEMGGSKVTDAGLQHLQASNHLGWIKLNDTQITDLGLKHLRNLHRLRWLELANTQVTDAGLVHLKSLTNLEFLFLNKNRISDAGLAHLERMRSLENVDLSKTQVEGAGLIHLKELYHLKTLVLSDTQLNDAGLEHLKGLTRLERLYLDGTQVTDAGLTNLTGMTSLSWLDLKQTQITQAGVDKLQQAIPRCSISCDPQEGRTLSQHWIAVQATLAGHRLQSSWATHFLPREQLNGH